MTFFDWEESFELGIPELDEHHQHLVDLLNELFDLRNSSENHPALIVVIGKLIDYSMYHFAAEEELLHRKWSHGLQLHLDEHKKFTGAMLRFREYFHAGKTGLSNEMLTFVKEWLFNHILIEDFKLLKSEASPGWEAGIIPAPPGDRRSTPQLV